MTRGAPRERGLDGLAEDAAASGLRLRGAFHPQPDDHGPDPDGAAGPCTVALLGFVGSAGFDRFAASAEASDGAPDPLDRWSARVIGRLAAEHGGMALFPFGGPPHWPFLRWARRADDVHPSPLGLLVHARWGLWHSYRGAIVLPGRRSLQGHGRAGGANPCSACPDKPCLTACPVGSFTGSGYDLVACTGHLRDQPATPCRSAGCLARHACPLGRDHAPSAAHARFTMEAFLAAHPGESNGGAA